MKIFDFFSFDHGFRRAVDQSLGITYFIDQKLFGSLFLF